MPSAVENYFSKTKDHLSKHRERVLVKKIEKGDDEAKKRLANYNLRLVIKMAKKYRDYSNRLDFLDLIQAGNVGLMEALERFDPDTGNKFSTYATWWIRQAIFKALNNKSRLIRVPAHKTSLGRKISKVEDKHKKDLTDEEIAEELDVSVEKVRVTRKATQLTRSLDKPVGEEGSARLLDLFSENISSEEIWREEFREKFKEIMDEHFTDREKQIVKLRYGLEDYQPRTLEEVGKVFDISRERIRQIQERAMGKLEKPEIKNKLRNLGLQ